MRVPIKSIRRGEPVSLAGFRFLKSKLGKASLTFRVSTENAIRLEVPNLGVLVPTKMSRKILKDIQHIPSIIGNDFLEDHRFTLFFNPSQKIAYLESEGS